MSRGSARKLLSAIVAMTAASAGAATGANATTIPPGTPDMTSGSSATVTFPGAAPSPAFSPKLLAVGRGSSGTAALSWSGPFDFHPLRFEAAGIAGNGSGDTTTRQLRAGHYAYYCANHGAPGGVGMAGEVYVAGPRASLKSTPADVAPGGTVTLDASATDLVSYDAATTATYAFDPEGDGTFLPAGGATSMQATYPSAGTIAARVRVTDNAGRVDEAAFDIDVAVPGTAPPGNPGDPPGDPANSPAATGGPSTPRTAVKFTDVATLPKFGRCVNRRRGVRITVRDSAGGDVRSVRVLVNGRTARRRSSVGRSATLNVRPLPRGRPLVKVVVTLAGGKQLSRTTRYRTCK